MDVVTIDLGEDICSPGSGYLFFYIDISSHIQHAVLVDM